MPSLQVSRTGCGRAVMPGRRCVFLDNKAMQIVDRRAFVGGGCARGGFFQRAPQADRPRFAPETSRIMAPRGAVPPEVAEDDGADYVKAWLCQVQGGSALQTSDCLAPGPSPGPSRPIWRPHLLPMQDGTLARGGLRQQSPSLFVRDSPLPSVSSKSSNHGACSAAGELFEKRRRRKTRRNRYETSPTKTGHAAGEKEPPRSTTKATRATRRVLRSSREVLNNFSSDSISNRRVTVRRRCCPSVTPMLTERR